LSPNPQKHNQVLAQNAGLQHGPHLFQWVPTLRLLVRRGILCAFTMFDAGELCQSLSCLAALPDLACLTDSAFIYSGQNPFASLFFGYLINKCAYSINNQMIILRYD
jgi:hypothetical protein